MLFKKMFGQKQECSCENKGAETFCENDYERFNEQKIREFCSRYDLNTVEGILSIPVSEAERFPDGGYSIVYMPEQILNRKATEYKKEKKYNLAIACLKKANELYRYSFYSYSRNDYERLVDIMIEAKMFDEARQTHKQLDETIGTYTSMLYELKEITCNTQKEKDNYQRTVIDKRTSDERDREIYYYLLENFPSIAPKSLGGFKKMKNSNSENYKKIVRCIEENIKVEDIQFWV